MYREVTFSDSGKNVKQIQSKDAAKWDVATRTNLRAFFLPTLLLNSRSRKLSKHRLSVKAKTVAKNTSTWKFMLLLLLLLWRFYLFMLCCLCLGLCCSLRLDHKWEKKVKVGWLLLPLWLNFEDSLDPVF